MDTDKRLYNQTALVTGGNTGIGSAIAKAMALAGANVAISEIVVVVGSSS